MTAERMARGGLYDQLAGGFARYSVDAQWVVPHFEKMLYDNALLLRVYAHLARVTGAELPRRVAEETAAFLLRDLRTAEGGFASALDADTDGVEGLTYAWTPDQLRAVLGDDDGDWAAALLAVTEQGTFEHGSSTLQLPSDPDDPARWARVRAALLAARNARPQPARDDKVITAWNGLAVLALAEGGAALGHPEWVDAAAEAAELLLDRHLVDGRLRRSSRGGVVGAAAGVLEDHAALADGLLALHQATGSARWLTAATELLDLALDHFAGPDGGFFDTADDAEALLHRPRERDRQRDPVRRRRRWPRRCSPRRCWSPSRPGTGTRPRRRCARAGSAGRAVPAVRRALAHRGRGAAARTAAGGRGRRRRDDRQPLLDAGPPARPRRLGDRGRGRRTRPGCRCWPTARWSTAARPPTSAAASSATARSRTPDELAAQLGADSAAPQPSPGSSPARSPRPHDRQFGALAATCGRIAPNRRSLRERPRRATAATTDEPGGRPELPTSTPTSVPGDPRWRARVRGRRLDAPARTGAGHIQQRCS